VQPENARDCSREIKRMPETAIIRQLHIERFRGIESLKWNPSSGMNVILGGGDVGKTTILEAIALLLSPSNYMVLAEADYWERKAEAGFTIRAAVSLPATSGIGQQAKFAWPWQWDGENAIPPISPQGDADDIPQADEAVYCLQVCGTPELEINWAVVQPNDEIDPLSAAVRRQIGLVRLGGDDRNDRDLRLVYGSALDRLLADRGLRARVGRRLAEIDLQENLSEEAHTALSALDETLKRESLPHDLELGLTSSQGLSIGALTGLFAKQSDHVSLPLTSWGAGTRRMATLQIAAATKSTTQITVVDEIERGLEPYRVRKLIATLQVDASQSFVTTHSSIAIGGAMEAHLWYLDAAGNIGLLPQQRIASLQRRDPVTFLSRFSIVCEGQTEIGFVSYLLDRAIDGRFRDHGIHLANGQGNESTLSVLEAMAKAGLTFAGFADHEGNAPNRWAALKANMNERLFQWQNGCLEENIIKHVEPDKLTKLIEDQDGDLDGDRLRTLADRLDCAEKDLDSLQSAAQAQGKELRALIIAAATGDTNGAPAGEEKAWKNGHPRKWFKSESGGHEFAAKMFALGLWPALKPILLPFLNAVLEAVGQDHLEDLAHER